MLDIKEDFIAPKEQTLTYIQEFIDKISPRFTKTYLNNIESVLPEKYYFFPVEFYERKNKTPTPQHKVLLIFKVPKSLQDEEISFQVDNESVFYPLFDSVNLHFFETLLDRVLLDKYKMSKQLLLHTNFESTRILTLNGENIKLFTIEEEENIFSNNKSEFYKYEGLNLNFTPLEVPEIDKLIKLLWKTLSPRSTNVATPESRIAITLEDFKILFYYGKLNMSEENMSKLWKYIDKHKKGSIGYEEFVNFSIFLIHCLRAYHIALYKAKNNQYVMNKIKNCVEIMNLHFKEYDFEENQEISFDNLKKCLLKENELFTRKEIEIILMQINPEKNFQYWKFDKILEILYTQHFNYAQLMKEDKIYKYLIKIFSKQDPYSTGKIHYKKMKEAFLAEDKLKMDKIEILIILNFFDINTNPNIDYFEASLIIRNIVEVLFSSDISMQKIDITQPSYMTFDPYEDEYDIHSKSIKELFIAFDQDYDHLLNENEFRAFIKWLIPYLGEPDFKEIFVMTDLNKDNMINFKEFKNVFDNLMKMTRIKNVIKSIATIIDV